MEIKLYSTLPSESVKIRKLVFVEEQGFKNEFEEIVYQYKGEYIMLHAQIQAQQFYEKHGYLSYGGIEYDENCPHIWMLKKII